MRLLWIYCFNGKRIMGQSHAEKSINYLMTNFHVECSWNLPCLLQHIHCLIHLLTLNIVFVLLFRFMIC